jgi:hypothetical protein
VRHLRCDAARRAFRAGRRRSSRRVVRIGGVDPPGRHPARARRRRDAPAAPGHTGIALVESRAASATTGAMCSTASRT